MKWWRRLEWKRMEETATATTPISGLETERYDVVALPGRERNQGRGRVDRTPAQGHSRIVVGRHHHVISGLETERYEVVVPTGGEGESKRKRCPL